MSMAPPATLPRKAAQVAPRANSPPALKALDVVFLTHFHALFLKLGIAGAAGGIGVGFSGSHGRRAGILSRKVSIVVKNHFRVDSGTRLEVYPNRDLNALRTLGLFPNTVAMTATPAVVPAIFMTLVRNFRCLLATRLAPLELRVMEEFDVLASSNVLSSKMLIIKFCNSLDSDTFGGVDGAKSSTYSTFLFFVPYDLLFEEAGMRGILFSNIFFLRHKIDTAMSMCEGVPRGTEHQAKELARLERLLRTVAAHMIATFPNEPAWKMMDKNWNGRVLLGPVPYVASFDIHSGCLVVGVHPHTSDPAVLNAKALLALSTGISLGKTCSDLHSRLLSEVTSTMKLPISLDCRDAKTKGLNTVNACPKCTWKEGAPFSCHVKRFVWPEYLGMYVNDVAEKLSKDTGFRVEMSPWDSLHHKPATEDVVRVTFDARTGIVVVPPPHLGSLNIPETDYNCFIKPDKESSVPCIGAPMPPSPDVWKRYIGFYVTDVVDALRVRYPHATIEYLPDTAGVSGDLRPDRIRVRFDTSTGKVVSIPTVG